MEDAELLELSLREVWPDLVMQFAETEPAFRSLLALAPDAVISDSNVPGFPGLAALAVCRAVAPQVPLLFFCGDRREELKQVALAGGAAAFVAKENPELLIAELKRLTTSGSE